MRASAGSRNKQSDDKPEKVTKEDRTKTKNVKTVKFKKKKSKSESDSESSSDEEEDTPPSKTKHMVSSTALEYDDVYSRLFYF